MSLQTQEQNLVEQLSRQLSQRQLNVSEILLVQKQAKRYHQLKEGTYLPAIKDDDQRAAEIERQVDKLKKIEEIVKGIEVRINLNLKSFELFFTSLNLVPKLNKHSILYIVI